VWQTGRKETDLEEKRDGGRLDGDTSLLLVVSGVHEPGEGEDEVNS
jgi:hypothetical protein